MLRSHKFRNELLRSGMNQETTEIYVYIDQVTRSGKKGIEVFEEKSLVGRVQLAILKRFDGLQPHIGNIERLYDDPEYRKEWVDKYQSEFSGR
jgi:hypothetical protein